MNTNKALLLVLWAMAGLFAVSVVLRFVVLSRVGGPVGWILYPGLPIGAAGALTVFLVRLGLLKFDEGSSGTFPHPHH